MLIIRGELLLVSQQAAGPANQRTPVQSGPICRGLPASGARRLGSDRHLARRWRPASIRARMSRPGFLGWMFVRKWLESDPDRATALSLRISGPERALRIPRPDRRADAWPVYGHPADLMRLPDSRRRCDPP